MTRFARHTLAGLFLLMLCGACLGDCTIGRCGWRSCTDSSSSFEYVSEADGGVSAPELASDAAIALP